jgi:hypothetical protein
VVVLAGSGPVVSRLPLAATLIAVTVPHLLDVPGFVRVWRNRRGETTNLALLPAVCVVAFGVLRGVLIAVLLSAAQMFRRTARPHDAVLATPTPDGPAHEVDEHALPRTDVLIYRVDAPRFFANIDRVTERIRTLAVAPTPTCATSSWTPEGHLLAREGLGRNRRTSPPPRTRRLCGRITPRALTPRGEDAHRMTQAHRALPGAC